MSEENNATICFTVNGQPKPLERARTYLNKAGKYASVLPSGSREYRYTVQAAIKQAMKNSGWLTTEAPIKLVVRIFRKGRREADITNIVKGIEDSANGFIWKDDSQVVALEATKEMRSDNPRVEVEVTALT